MVVGAISNEEVSQCKSKDYFTAYIYSADSFSRELFSDN
jgi:hypothetical protein